MTKDNQSPPEKLGSLGQMAARLGRQFERLLAPFNTSDQGGSSSTLGPSTNTLASSSSALSDVQMGDVTQPEEKQPVAYTSPYMALINATVSAVQEDGDLETQQRTPIDRRITYAHVGGPVDEETKDYFLICMQSAPDCKVTILTDKYALFASQMKQLIDKLYREGRCKNKSEEERVTEIIALRKACYSDLKDRSTEERKEVWIKWLVRHCDANEEQLRTYFSETETKLAALAHDLTSAIGFPPDKVEVRDVREYFSMPSMDNDEVTKFVKDAIEAYDQQIIERNNFSGASNLIRPFAGRGVGGFWLDTDQLPAFLPTVVAPPEFVPYDLYTRTAESRRVQREELHVQHHLFQHHADWINPHKPAIAVDQNDEAASNLETEFHEAGISKLEDLFQPIGEMLAPKKLFLMRYDAYGIDDNRLAAHKDSPALALVSILQVEILSYLKKFDEAFGKTLAKLRPNDLLIDETRKLREVFFKSYLNENPFPICGPLTGMSEKFIGGIIKMHYVKAVADYPYDGLVPGCKGTGKLLATLPYFVVGCQLLKKEVEPDVFAKTFGLSPNYFCQNTISDEKSSWSLKGARQTSNRYSRIPVPFKQDADDPVHLPGLAIALASMSDRQINECCQINEANYDQPVSGNVVKHCDDGAILIYQEGAKQSKPLLLKVPANKQPSSVNPLILNKVSFVTPLSPAITASVAGTAKAKKTGRFFGAY